MLNVECYTCTSRVAATFFYFSLHAKSGKWRLQGVGHSNAFALLAAQSSHSLTQLFSRFPCVQPAALDSRQCVRAGSEVSVTVLQQRATEGALAPSKLRCMVLATPAERVLVDTDVDIQPHPPHASASMHEFTWVRLNI